MMVEGLLSKFQVSIGVSQYTQGTWELKSIVVSSNVQAFERGLPMYTRYVEEPYNP